MTEAASQVSGGKGGLFKKSVGAAGYPYRK